jgi:hypothetical protein
MGALWRCGTIRRDLCTLAVLFPPRVAGDNAQVIEAHFAKEVFPFMGNDGNKVSALGGVIVILEADRATVMGKESGALKPKKE